MDDTTPDIQLIKTYKLGNEKALEILINKYKKDVFRFIYSKVKDKEIADDIFQETFIKVIIALNKKSYNEDGKFLFWIFRVANNLMMDYFRMSNRRYLFLKINDYSNLENNLICDYIDADELISLENKYNIIKELIQEKLLYEQRQVLELRFGEKMSFKEIALIQGVNINTALGRYRYAINNLRKEMEKLSYYV
jgi:RNA polymerase sigma-70 factor (ECF subfamily)